MDIVLLTSKTGINVNNKKSKYHKYDGKDTFCNSLKNDGLKYEHIIHRVSPKKYNYLQQNNEICKNCDMKKHFNKIMREGKNHIIKKPQSDIMIARMDKAEFDVMQDISLGEE